MEIRQVVKESIENRDISQKVPNTLATLLGKDANGISEDEIKALASVIFDFIKEEVEKA
ncbi:MAG: hypothetical protein ACXABC_16715 [Candidatus Thorarchaeota archaeon]|jgi:hypothetical protein